MNGKWKKICSSIFLAVICMLTASLFTNNLSITALAAEMDILDDSDEEKLEEPRKEAGEEKGELASVEVSVPIYNYNITNIVAPTKFAVALNPYQMEVRIDDTEVSTEQIVSKKYGIINKSSTDQIVTVSLTVEDLNGGKIVFVDSVEEVKNADEDVYAVYLAAVPADENGIRVDKENVDQNTSASDLAHVDMDESLENALSMKEGDNKLSFKLSKAVYSFEDGDGLSLDEGEYGGNIKLSSLASDGRGAAAFTFAGCMNPKADWGKLIDGIQITVAYTYKTAAGDETVIEGTCGMLRLDRDAVN